MDPRGAVQALFVAGLLSSCARYHPVHAPSLDLDGAAAAYSARRLDDSAVTRVLSDAGDPVSDSGWDADQLALAALYFRGEVPLARAAVAEARAAEVTAGARPSPSVEASVTRTARPLENARTSWSEAITAGVTFELGGKRAARRARARAATLAARLRVEGAAWQLAQDARSAGLAVLAAEQDAADVAAEAEALRTVAGLLRARYAEGQLTLAEVARADAEMQAARVSFVDANRVRADTRLALARTLAVPFDRVDTLPLRASAASGCEPMDSVTALSGEQRRRVLIVRDSLASLALNRRPDIGAALADYAVAEGDVRLEVARQYPDLTIGPGLLWDQGIPGWVLNVGLPALLIGRNRGPIAEAEARRTEQATRARILQDSVLAAVDSSVVACVGLGLGLATADSLVAATQRQLTLAQAAYDRGEAGQTEVAFARLAVLRARRTRRLASWRRAVAGAALHRATGSWTTGGRVPWAHLTLPSDP
jgi:outer membrane protein TolC